MKCCYCEELIEDADEKFNVSRFEVAHKKCQQPAPQFADIQKIPITAPSSNSEVKTYILIESKYKCKCGHCKKKILEGHKIYWKRGDKVLHRECYLERLKTLPISEV